MRRKAQHGLRTYIPYDKATGEGGYTIYTPLNSTSRRQAAARRRDSQAVRRGIQ